MKMRILTNTGIEDATVSDRQTASMIGHYWNDVRQFLSTGDTSVLDPYVGVVIDGFGVETDPDLIEEFDDEGQLDFRYLYTH